MSLHTEGSKLKLINLALQGGESMKCIMKSNKEKAVVFNKVNL